MCESPRLWFWMICMGSEEMEFVPCVQDWCMFVNKEKQVILLLCTNDVLLFAKTDKVLDQVPDELRHKFQLMEQDFGKDTCACLGIDLKFLMDEQGHKTVTMTQDGLIKKRFLKRLDGQI